MAASTRLVPGTVVRVISPDFQNQSDYTLEGIITECRPLQNGYLVRPLNIGPNGSAFGWGYNELEFVRDPEPVSRYVRLLQPIL